MPGKNRFSCKSFEWTPASPPPWWSNTIGSYYKEDEAIWANADPEEKTSITINLVPSPNKPQCTSGHCSMCVVRARREIEQMSPKLTGQMLCRPLKKHPLAWSYNMFVLLELNRETVRKTKKLRIPCLSTEEWIPFWDIYFLEQMAPKSTGQMLCRPLKKSIVWLSKFEYFRKQYWFAASLVLTLQQSLLNYLTHQKF